ncbi:MAG: Amuc_1098 family type IV pilus outer membrane protein [Verrucomicrobiales bacterium]
MRASVTRTRTNRLLAAAVAAVLASDMAVMAGEGFSSSSTTDIAEREIIRRQERIATALIEEEAGDKAMAEKDYEAALAHYRTALDLLPVAPMASNQRERVIAKYADAAVRLAEVRADAGEYDAARNLLNMVLAPGVDPDNARAKRLLERLEDPEWYNPANSKEHTQNVQEVKRHLQLGWGHYDLGDFDKARDAFNQVLIIDRYNTAARRGLERVERNISEHYLSARDHTRAKMMREVDAQWETSVPVLSSIGSVGGGDRGGGIDSSAVLLDKMDSIIIPEVALDQAPIEEAVEFLRIKSRELDPGEPKKGVNFILRLPAAGVVPKITVNLSNVSLGVAVKTIADLAGLRSRVEPYAVIISAVDEGVELYTRVFKVPPYFLSAGGTPAGEAGGAAAPDPFAAGGATPAGGSALQARATALDILKQAGIAFPEGGSAFFSAANSTLTVRNTPANLDLVASFVESFVGQVQRMINITAKFVEVSQLNTDEMGFDWLVGAFNVPGSGRVFGAGGTAGNRAAGPVGALNWPLVPPAQGGQPLPVGGANLLTGSLRFGNDAISNNAIDALIQQRTTIEGSAEASVTPAVFGVAGVFTDPQFQVVMRALKQKKGADLLSAPQITTRSGQRAKIEVIREFIYPTEFEPPEIPQDFGSSNVGGGLLGLGQQRSASVSSFPVTPTTPTAFETRNTGVTLEVEPTLGQDGYTIDLTLAPEVIEFEGFINYGSPIQTGATDALGNPTTVILTENRIEQPVFSTRRLNTAVTIWDGMTLGVGGLIREDVQTVEDKVPIFGDIPLIGRFFRTKADQVFKRNLMMFVTVKLVDPSGQTVNVKQTTTTEFSPPPEGPATPLIPMK